MIGKLIDFGKNIYMVCGGFNLMDKSDEEMKAIISEMKEIGVESAELLFVPVKEIKLFKDAFNENYLKWVLK